MNNKYINNSLWIIVCKAIQAVIALVVGALTARYLGPTNYGTINYVAAYVTFFVCFTNLGMNSIAVNELLSAPKNEGKIMGTMTLSKIFSSIISIGCVVSIIAIVDWDEKTTIIVAGIYSTYLFFQSFQTFELWFQSRLQSKISSLVALIAYIIMSVYKVFLLVTDKSIYWFAFSTSVDAMISTVIMIIMYKKYGGQKLEFSKNLLKEILDRSHPFIWAGLLQVLYTKTDTIMLKHMINEAEVGIYTSAANLVSYGKVILAAINESARPAIITAKHRDEELYSRRIRQTYCITSIIGLAIAIAIMSFASPMVNVIYGVDYSRAVVPLMILAWDPLLLHITTIRNIWIVCQNRQIYIIVFCMMAVIVNIILNYILIPIFSASGAAFSTIITQIVSGIIAPYMFKQTRQGIKYFLEATIFSNVLSKDERNALVSKFHSK